MEQAPTRVVMTLMVRNECDVIAAMIEHHLAQGVHHIIVTDNGSTDGTREIIADYAETAAVTLHDEPSDGFPQAEVVTRMAREAYTAHKATWVLNADADEFWVAEDSSKTIVEALSTVPDGIESFVVPVVNMLGRPLVSGSPFENHVWRDDREESALQSVGLHAQPTHNLVHAGRKDVTVASGNHYSSLPTTELDQVPSSNRLRTYHFPWRSWEGFRSRTVRMGEAFERSGQEPSPRHHIMRDLRWDRAGVLQPFFVARHPEFDDDGACITRGFVRDDRISRMLRNVRKGARLPARLDGALVECIHYSSNDEATQRELFALLGAPLVQLEEARAVEVTSLRLQNDGLREELGRRSTPEEREALQQQLASTSGALAAAQGQIGEWIELWQALRRNPLGRVALRANVVIARLARMRGRASGSTPPTNG